MSSRSFSHQRRFRPAVFFVPLLLVLVAVRAEPLPFQYVYEVGKTTVPYEDENGKVEPKIPTSFRIPALIEIDGAALALTDARYNSSDDHSFIETASRLSIDGGRTWTTQIAIKNKRVNSTFSRVMDPTVIVKGKKAYVLVGSWNKSGTPWVQQGSGDDWDALLTVGEIRRKTENGTTTGWMDWGKPISLRHLLPENILGAKSSQFLGGVGTGLVTKNGTLVFPVQACNVLRGYTSTILYSTDDGATWHFGKGYGPNGCSESNVLEWDDKIIMNVRRDDGYRMVFETSDMGTTWTETPISRVWGGAPDRTGPGCQGSFITIPVNGKKAMLLSIPRNTKGYYERDQLLLWLSDGNRIAEIGQISDGDINTGYSSLAYFQNTVHVAYEVAINPEHDDRNRSIILEPLPDFTRRIETVLEQWAAQDRLLASAGVPTAGLVSLLSDNADGAVWHDAFDGGVDAATTNARKVANGVQFTGGRLGGAQWPVTTQGQFQRFIFTRERFTLAAAITVDELTNHSRNSPLGAALDASGEAKLLALRYTADGAWNPVFGNISDKIVGSVQERREYHVALVFDAGVGRVYVDGKELEGAPAAMRYIGTAVANIHHFYIGGYADGKLDGDCRSTVRNVMLYNRALSEEEIVALYMNRGKIRSGL